MADRQLELWINERWYAALEKHFGGEDALRQKLEDMLDGLIDQLPDRVRDQVSWEIREEQLREKLEYESHRVFAVFQVTEQGRTNYVLSETTHDTLNAASLLREYTRGKCRQEGSFSQILPERANITQAKFESHTREYLNKSSRVTGVFKVDLDGGTFSALTSADGWHTYPIRDISNAVYRAMRKTFESWIVRVDIFAEQLEGKEITPEHRLDVNLLSFADELIEIDGQLNFYVENDFDPDHAFGTYVCTEENDDWVNVYANYDIGKGQVCGALEVNLCRGNGTEKTMLYPLSAAEKKVLAGKMEAFCLEQTGQSLKDYCAQTQAEDMEPSAGPTMG